MQRSDDGSRPSPAADRGGESRDESGQRSHDESRGSPPADRGDQTDIAASYRKAGPYLDASWQLAGSVALWVLVGYFLDKWLHTAPWLLVAGSVIGMGIGFYLFFKSLTAIGKDAKR